VCESDLTRSPDSRLCYVDVVVGQRTTTLSSRILAHTVRFSICVHYFALCQGACQPRVPTRACELLRSRALRRFILPSCFLSKAAGHRPHHWIRAVEANRTAPSASPSDAPLRSYSELKVAHTAVSGSGGNHSRCSGAESARPECPWRICRAVCYLQRYERKRQSTVQACIKVFPNIRMRGQKGGMNSATECIEIGRAPCWRR
jgi:hypothetical protein